MTMYFDTETGELNPSKSIGIELGAWAGWTPYYNLKGKYVGYRCGTCSDGYYNPKQRYVLSYEDLDW